MKKVLVFEPNPYHNEVLPGIVKYFEDLDYIADVYVREECFEDSAFCRYKIRGERKAYSLENATAVLSDKRINEYDFIFFSSMEHCEGDAKRFLTELGFIPKTKYGILGMYHSNWLIDEFNDHELLNQGRLFCISRFQTKKYSGFHTLAPVYFGNKSDQKHTVSGKTTLLLVGNAANFPAIADAWWHLDKETRKTLQIKHVGKLPHEDKSFKGFLYKIYCKAVGVFDYRHRSTAFIDKLGQLSFAEMFNEIEQSDFLLSMVDPDNEDDRHYIESNTSGIRQLAIGFRKPVIIKEEVADAYDIPESGSIRYTKGSLRDAFRKASGIDSFEYDRLMQAMTDTYNRIYKVSLEHLGKTVAKLTEKKE